MAAFYTKACKFNAQNAKFGEFMVWQDANQNGVSDAGEMHTLATLACSKKPNRSDRVGLFLGVLLGEQVAWLKMIRRPDGAQDVEIVDYHARTIDEKNNPTNYTRVAR